MHARSKQTPSAQANAISASWPVNAISASVFRISGQVLLWKTPSSLYILTRESASKLTPPWGKLAGKRHQRKRFSHQRTGAVVESMFFTSCFDIAARQVQQAHAIAAQVAISTCVFRISRQALFQLLDKQTPSPVDPISQKSRKS